MHENRHIYETAMINTLKFKTPSNEVRPLAMDKKLRRVGQKPKKNTPEMIAIVLRLIEYFENS